MSPPGPLRWGSTTCSVKPAATAASKALPPRSRTAIPAALASQCVEATMPNVPRSSGRVVNKVISDIAPRLATVDGPAGAGDQACLLRAEEGDDGGHLLGVSETAQRQLP